MDVTTEHFPACVILSVMLCTGFEFRVQNLINDLRRNTSNPQITALKRNQT